MEKQQLRGLTLYKAIRNKLKFISDYRAKGGTLEELEKMGYKFGKVDLKNTAMEEQTVATSEVAEHKGIALFKKAQAKKKFVSEHLTKGGTVEELRQMCFKFGTLDVRNLTTKEI